MKLPRDLSGKDLAQLLRQFGYEIVRQEGSHIRLVSGSRGHPNCSELSEDRSATR